jgi:hypothetical protein
MWHVHFLKHPWLGQSPAQVSTTLTITPNSVESVKHMSKQTSSTRKPAEHAAQPRAVSMACTVAGTVVRGLAPCWTMTCTVVGWLLPPSKLGHELPCTACNQKTPRPYCMRYAGWQQQVCPTASATWSQPWPCTSSLFIGCLSTPPYLDHQLHKATLPDHYDKHPWATCSNLLSWQL